MKLSLLIPVYNESRVLPAILEKLSALRIPNVDIEFVIVDDASSDGSARILERWAGERPNARFLRHPRNAGKGAAIRTALALATGDVVVIQDADLEYEPADLPALLQPILDSRADVVFGSRNLTDNPRYSPIYYWGNLFLNACVFCLYGHYVSDMETCYKMMRRDVFLSLDLRANKFDIEPEITAKLLRRGHRIHEIPIRYAPRSRAEGKKITWRDGLSAIRTLIRWRFARLPLICILLACVVCFASIDAAGAESEDKGKLRRVEDKMGRPKETTPEDAAKQRKEEDKERQRQKDRERWRRDHPGESAPDWVGLDAADLFWQDFVWIAAAAPFAVPYYLLGDDYQEPHGFASYPFAGGSDGLTMMDGRSWMVNSNIAMQRLSGNTTVTRGDFTVNFWRRFAVEGAYSKYGERLKNRTEFLSFSEGLVTFTFARADVLDFRAGLGFQSIDGRNIHHGIKWAYRIRWFHQPVQVNLDLGATTAVGASTLSEIAPSLGWHIGRYEYKLAYRRLKISGDLLAGPELAVRVWF